MTFMEKLLFWQLFILMVVLGVTGTIITLVIMALLKYIGS